EAERIGAVPLQALVLANLGEIALSEGKTEEAHRRLEDAMALARDLDDRRLHSETARNLGLLELEGGNLARAKELVERALALADRGGLRHRGARAPLALGEGRPATLYAAGERPPADADDPFERALAIFRAIGNQAVLAKGLERFGRHKLERGDTARGK